MMNRLDNLRSLTSKGMIHSKPESSVSVFRAWFIFWQIEHGKLEYAANKYFREEYKKLPKEIREIVEASPDVRPIVA